MLQNSHKQAPKTGAAACGGMLRHAAACFNRWCLGRGLGFKWGREGGGWHTQDPKPLAGSGSTPQSCSPKAASITPEHQPPFGRASAAVHTTLCSCPPHGSQSLSVCPSFLVQAEQRLASAFIPVRARATHQTLCPAVWLDQPPITAFMLQPGHCLWTPGEAGRGVWGPGEPGPAPPAPHIRRTVLRGRNEIC